MPGEQQSRVKKEIFDTAFVFLRTKGDPICGTVGNGGDESGEGEQMQRLFYLIASTVFVDSLVDKFCPALTGNRSKCLAKQIGRNLFFVFIKIILVCVHNIAMDMGAGQVIVRIDPSGDGFRHASHKQKTAQLVGHLLMKDLQ